MVSHVNMDPATRVEAVHILRTLLKQVVVAETLLSQGQSAKRGGLFHDPAIMRSLLKARRLGGQAAAAVIANCLRQALAAADSADRYTRAQSLDEFFRLIAFVESTLCPNCRRRVAAKLKEKCASGAVAKRE